MLLNAEQIKKLKLLKRTTDKNFIGAASYNLSVGQILTMDGKIHTSYKLPPRGMILVTTKEIFDLPENIIGYTTVKNSLSIIGIMAINIGIVDPNYKEPISSLLINFGKHDHLIEEDDTFLRMTFHKFENFNDSILSTIKVAEHPNDDTINNDYLKKRKKIAVNNLSDTFLSISQIKLQIVKKVWINFFTGLGILTIVITIVSFTLTYTKEFLKYKKVKEKSEISIQLEELKDNIQNNHSMDSVLIKIQYLESQIKELKLKKDQNEGNSMGRTTESGK
ncbi:dCTP deaminase domain-containing protein [Labilibaculum euxinus]